MRYFCSSVRLVGSRTSKGELRSRLDSGGGAEELCEGSYFSSAN